MTYSKRVISYLLIVCFLFVPIITTAQNLIKEDIHIINLIENCKKSPQRISYNNSIIVNNSGGHIQGIQYYSFEGADYIYISGSSDSYSYLSIVSVKQNETISLNKILSKPFKHAGGFQIWNNLLAIGIEKVTR